MYDVAVVISNDSDLATPIQIATQAMGKTVGVLSPFGTVTWPLKQVATFYRPIRRHLLNQCALPNVLHDATVPITKPPSW
jgi:hypothetical protein